MKRSIAERSTRIRDRAQQSWPALPNTAPGAAAAARSRSASAKITLADLPPELERDPLDRLRRAGGDRAPDRRRAGERDLRDVGVLDQPRARRPSPAPTTTLTTPSGSPASSAMRSKRSAVSGVSSAGLSTIVLPGRERRRHLPRGDRQREVPRRDQPDDAERLADGERLPAATGIVSPRIRSGIPA
jgi:hypothetical protein